MRPFTSPYPEVDIQDIRGEYDYIVVGTLLNLCRWPRHALLSDVGILQLGGGTAGCVLANRLSASPSTNVLLLERGPLSDGWVSRVPLLSSDFMSNGSCTMIRKSEYQPELGRSIDLYHGSVLGGSSSINQMLYTRGLPEEYDLWAEAGCPGWSWNTVVPYFKRSENALDSDVDTNVHGTTGMPFHIFMILHELASYQNSFSFR